MTTIFYEREPLTPAIQTRDFSITENDGAAKLVSGRDKSGKRWTLLLPSATHGLWEIKRGAGRVYYFAGYTGGAGMAPGTWIVVLSFDKQARPNPFYLNTYNGYDHQGITDLLDLDKRGPELLQQDWVETNRVPDTRSGYFITAAYIEQGNYWYRADGRHGSNVFPAFEKWALLPYSGPQRIAASESLAKFTSDYGNDPRAGTDARIVGVDDHAIHTEHLDCELQSINVIVNDSQRGREIEVGHFYAGIASRSRAPPRPSNLNWAETMAGQSHLRRHHCLGKRRRTVTNSGSLVVTSRAGVLGGIRNDCSR